MDLIQELKEIDACWHGLKVRLKPKYGRRVAALTG